MNRLLYKSSWLLSFLLVIWCPLLGFGAPGGSIYWVEGVTVTVAPASTKAKETKAKETKAKETKAKDDKAGEGKALDLRQAGLVQAKRLAFERLLKRMVTDKDRLTHARFLEAIVPQATEMVERAVVRSEKPRPDGLLLTVDILFAQNGIRSLLATESGLTFNETGYPQVLVAVNEKSGKNALVDPQSEWLRSLRQMAAEAGINLLLPQGDLDDLTNLAWERIQTGNPQMLQWAASRYGAGLVWGLTGEVTQPGNKGRYVAVAHIFESAPNGVNDITVQADGTFDNQAQAKSALLDQLGPRLVVEMAERWIRSHLVNPGMQHALNLRVVHEMRMAEYSKFLKMVREIPGVTGVRFADVQARQALLAVEFQGDDEGFLALLDKQGIHPEKNSDDEWVVRIP